MDTEHDDTALYNLVHSAATWLQRMGAAEDDHVVACVLPRASIGVWREGWQHVKTVGAIGDAEAEVMEALAPAIQLAIEQLQERARLGLNGALAHGWTLRALIAPAMGSMRIEAMQDAVRVEIATAYLVDGRQDPQRIEDPSARH